MPNRLEITLKEKIVDAEGDSIRQKAKAYFGLNLDKVRTIHVLTFDTHLKQEQLSYLSTEIFTNPVTQESSFEPLDITFDWCIWVGFRPGVRDNPGSTAVEALEDALHLSIGKDEAVYTSRRYCISGKALTPADMDLIASKLLANDIIQQWKIFSAEEWDCKTGIGYIIPKVKLNHVPTVTTISIDSDQTLARLSEERNLALHPNDIPVIRNYFLKDDVQASRKRVGLSAPTDIELEYISQSRSDHCNHNTFRGIFHYRDPAVQTEEVIESLFKTCIEGPTLQLKNQKDWVVSVLWDNAGVGRFDQDHYYTITGETHNSPSNMEAYGGAITGIVGVYRDPMGTGKGSKLVMGSYGFCVGRRDYRGDLTPRLHPRRLLDGIVEGVKDGGNKSGIPTTFGQLMFHDGYMGKCLVFVTALGIMPSLIKGQPSEEKKTSPGELIIMCGGRVGKDGIHGVTASSEVFSENTPAGHVQIGDPYTQKKMHDFLLEARDQGLIRFITDNGGGGLSSSIGESAEFAGGCIVELDKVPLKYEGLDQWEIWVSESQERMTVAIAPEHLEQFMVLSKRHVVESTVIGEYTDTGKLHITYKGETCAYMDLNLLSAGFPRWEFDAVWQPPEDRGLFEPVIGEPKDFAKLIIDLLARPNICSKEWITRQYDHEVQGGSVIKPLVGVDRDVNSDASVIRPVVNTAGGLAFSQSLLPAYSVIDAYHMTSCTIDEAVRRLIAVGADFEQIGGVDNFCWPNIQYDPKKNPDGKFKAAQLVRSCKALKDICLAYGLPLLSGKDSMYVDGHLVGRYGETVKVSALETMQFSAVSVVDDIEKCVTMEAKAPGDLVYVIGMTRDELGASEYYEHLGFTGLNVPKVHADEFPPHYRALSTTIKNELVASVHGVYRGGLGVHLALVAMGGNLGIHVDLAKVPCDKMLPNATVLFSESAGRFIVTIDPKNRSMFEAAFNGLTCCCIGQVCQIADGLNVAPIKNGRFSSAAPFMISIKALKTAWKKPFGELI